MPGQVGHRMATSKDALQAGYQEQHFLQTRWFGHFLWCRKALRCEKSYSDNAFPSSEVPSQGICVDHFLGSAAENDRSHDPTRHFADDNKVYSAFENMSQETGCVLSLFMKTQVISRVPFRLFFILAAEQQKLLLLIPFSLEFTYKIYQTYFGGEDT